MGELEDVSGEFGDEQAADGAAEAGEADDRGDGAAREHVGGEGVDVRRPGLVAGRGEADQGDGAP